MTTTATTARGGDWLIGDVPADAVFTREQLSEEHRLVGRTAEEFVEQEVTPALPVLEQKHWSRARELIVRAGELGLIGTDVPERFGGVGLDKVAAIVVGEAIGPSASFATTFGAQTGLVIIPILCFGTEAQQQQYLPRIVSGELIGAYCLSESGSGSDALGARARAVRAADGSWRLSGEKMWITNGGFADVFIVFAKVDGEQFSAFIVERGFTGVTSGKEEHKLGLHGSSTTPLILQDAHVPAENLLGEIGRGHKIAFNVLNYGRFKLAAMCSGGARDTIDEAVKYALSRRQFGQPIAEFGAIRQKLADMTIWQYAVESMLYRTAGLIDAAHRRPARQQPGRGGGARGYAIESSILKIAGSEMLDFVIDEDLQIHGGNGFVADYAPERRYRDARVNRIFEGTNEINRLLVPSMLVKRAMKGNGDRPRLELIRAAKGVQDELLAPPAVAASTSAAGPLADERRAIDGHEEGSDRGDRARAADARRAPRPGAGGPAPPVGYRHGHVRRGERDIARHLRRRRCSSVGVSARRRRAGVHPRRCDARRRQRPHRPRGARQRRRAAHLACRAAAAVEGRAGEHHCGPAGSSGARRRQARVSLQLTTHN